MGTLSPREIGGYVEVNITIFETPASSFTPSDSPGSQSYLPPTRVSDSSTEKQSIPDKRDTDSAVGGDGQ